MHSNLKALGEYLLRRAGPASIARRLHAGRSLILAYHNVVPTGEPVVGDRSLHMPQRQFAKHLDVLLEEDIEVVPLDVLICSAWNSDIQTRRVSITFDDAYSGAVTAGIGELVRRSLPATVFVVPGLLEGRSFWWDVLSTAPAGLSDAVREAALNQAHGRNDEVLHWARRQQVATRTPPPHCRSASSADLRAAVLNPGISLGSHTWSHPNLARLSEDECRNELARAIDWLRDEHELEPGWLSYPYGLYGSAAERAAAVVGHAGALRIDGGWLPREQPSVFQMPRLNVPAGLSRDGFALRVSGLLAG